MTNILWLAVQTKVLRLGLISAALHIWRAAKVSAGAGELRVIGPFSGVSAGFLGTDRIKPQFS
jgi:hypothetical protein